MILVSTCLERKPFEGLAEAGGIYTSRGDEADGLGVEAGKTVDPDFQCLGVGSPSRSSGTLDGPNFIKTCSGPGSFGS